MEVLVICPNCLLVLVAAHPAGSTWSRFSTKDSNSLHIVHRNKPAFCVLFIIHLCFFLYIFLPAQLSAVWEVLQSHCSTKQPEFRLQGVDAKSSLEEEEEEEEESSGQCPALCPETRPGCSRRAPEEKKSRRET